MVYQCKATAKLHQSKVKYNIYKLHQSKGKIKNRTYTNYIIDRAGKFINGTAAALYIFIIRETVIMEDQKEWLTSEANYMQVVREGHWQWCTITHMVPYAGRACVVSCSDYKRD